MNSLDLSSATAAQLISALQAGTISSLELTQAYLQRIEKFNPAVNAVVTIDHEGALASAAAVPSSSRLAFATGRPVNSQIIVWKLSRASRRPWAISAW